MVLDQVLLVMSGNRNYFLSDITVCNDMTKDAIAMYGCIPMTEFGKKCSFMITVLKEIGRTKEVI